MSEHLSTAGREVSRYEQRLRVRVFAWALVGAMALAAGTAAACLGVGGLLVGAAPHGALSVALWLATLGLSGWAASRAVRSLARARGPGIARVLRHQSSELADDTRSALELVRRPEGSGELVEALIGSVHERLSLLRPGDVTRPSAQQVRLAGGTLLAGCALLVLVSNTDRGRAGLFALTHPEWSGAETRQGVWVERFELSATPPAHIAAPARRFRDGGPIDVHAGSRVTLRVRSRIPMSRARVVIGELELPFQRESEELFKAEWVAEAEGALHLEGYRDGWLRDAEQRTLRVLPDHAPRVTLSSPAEDLRVAPSQRVPLRFEASDDHGLAGIDLVVRGPGAQEHRQRMAAPASGERRQTLGGEMVLRASDFQVRPGDTLSLWLEASDLNRHVGPLVGHSAIRTLTVAGAESEHGASVQSLTRAREQGLSLLGDRLEDPVPASERAARRRHRPLERATRSWLTTLHRAESDVDEDTAELLRGMQQRVRRALSKEHRLYGQRASRSARRNADERAITGLEGDVLWLDDLLAQARIDDAEDVLEQIHAAEQRMRSLLKELSRTPDEASKRALLAEIARMRAQLSELMAKLHDVRGTVPAEFVNREAMRAAPQQDALSKLEKAVQNGEVESAQAALDALAQQLSQLEQGLGETGVALASARFKPRNQATQDTLKQLSQLEEAQRGLAQDTNAIGREAAARQGAEASARSQAQGLSREAERLADQLDSLGPGAMRGPLDESRSTAAQRLRDVGAALSTGDYFEGETMARQAAAEMRSLARELEMDARMFPGSDGSLQESARQAEQLREQADELAREVAEASPNLDKLLDEGDRKRVRQQATPQGELARDTHAAREKLQNAQGDDGVSAGAAGRLGDVEDAMRRAGKALERGELQDAQAHQREAMQRMAQLREDLDRQASAGSPGGGNQEGTGRQQRGHGENDERVTIPNDANASRRSALRRRVLDARRGDVPPGYESSVETYYEELLR